MINNNFKETIVPLSIGLTCLASVVLGNNAEASTLFTANLSGSQQVPVNASTATGFASVLLNNAEDEITVNVSYSGVASTLVAGHIHNGAAGTNGPVIFGFTGLPVGTSGIIPEQIFSINPLQVQSLQNGLFYVNLHNANFPGGEIRGQLQAAVPEHSLSIFGLVSAMGLAAGLKRKQIKVSKKTAQVKK